MIRTFNKRLTNRDATMLHKNKVTKIKNLAPRKHEQNVKKLFRSYLSNAKEETSTKLP
jgi:hypothetical protein